MNKKALETFAPTERTNLRQAVERRLSKLGINAKSSYKSETEWLSLEDGIITINGVSYTEIPRDKFSRLFREYKAVGYDSLVEETAYTWFNRLIAIRYMEVKSVLPDIVKIVGNNGVVPRPEILTNYRYLGNLINSYEIENLKLTDEESAYRKLFLAACNKLGDALAFLFKPLDDWMELLLPDKMLEPGGIIDRIVTNEGLTKSFEEGVESIGWLYQFYMSEKKKQVGGLKNIAVKKEDLPVVTQLFTPRWIVEYLIENSLGKIYDEKYKGNNLSDNWSYYLKHDNPESKFPELNNLEEFKFFDPACGSGHILVAAFEYFYEMYLEQGYKRTEIPILILEKNLYGCEIDKRATQIASFAVFMKAAEKDPRIIRRSLVKKLNIIEIEDSISLTDEEWNWVESNSVKQKILKETVHQFTNGKQFGSLIEPKNFEYDFYIEKIKNFFSDKTGDLVEIAIVSNVSYKLLPVLEQANILANKYEIIVTNPPYHTKYNDNLKEFMNKNYNDYKSDLYSAFIYRTSNMIQQYGYAALMTPFTWMFLSYHEKLRKYLIDSHNIVSLVQLEYSSFKEATVPLCTFVLQKSEDTSTGIFLDLSSFKGEMLQPKKVKEAVLNRDSNYIYLANKNDFSKIPGYTFAYWLSNDFKNIFNFNPFEIYTVSDGQNKTGNNDKYLKKVWEIDKNRIINKEWLLYGKGGGFRRWAGNLDTIIDWTPETREFYRKDRVARILPEYLWYQKGITWGTVTSNLPSFRLLPEGCTFDSKGSTVFIKEEKLFNYFLGILNSRVSTEVLKVYNPTVSFQVRDIRAIPIKLADDVIRDRVSNIVEENIDISENDWNFFEVSWRFKGHPFITFKQNSTLLEEAYKNWDSYTSENYAKLKNNEEELNKIFIKLYNLENELNYEVPDKEITVSLSKKEQDVRSFLSYFIGCLFGRYSLDFEGLAFAGGKFDDTIYNSFEPNKDGIITVTDEKILPDELDIYESLKEFLIVIFGQETLHDNLTWIAQSLGQKSDSIEKTIRNYFIKNFYKDHTQLYQKRPIYWQIDSGKENGMKSLIYLHRYNPQTLGLVMNTHFVPLLSQCRILVQLLEEEINNGSLSATEKKEKTKQLNVYKKRVEELEKFQDKLHEMAREEIPIDLDSGVKENYQIFESILTPIKM